MRHFYIFIFLSSHFHPTKQSNTHTCFLLHQIIIVNGDVNCVRHEGTRTGIPLLTHFFSLFFWWWMDLSTGFDSIWTRTTTKTWSHVLNETKKLRCKVRFTQLLKISLFLVVLSLVFVKQEFFFFSSLIPSIPSSSCSFELLLFFNCYSWKWMCVCKISLSKQFRCWWWCCWQMKENHFILNFLIISFYFISLFYCKCGSIPSFHLISSHPNSTQFIDL